ncbi:MAG: alkaline phosphatase family protein, partial [Phycisphaerae bacterium]
MSKFVLLGLDGATFEMLGPMVDTGRLPVLQRLVEQGASGTLTSTVPPYTCPAWPTMFTGRNPGAHGVTSFHLLEPDTVESRAATLRDVAAPRLWQTLNSAGVRTGIFNVPMTYPAEPVDGFMVSGFVAPPGAPHAVQPQPLAEAFAEAFPDYDVNGPELGGRIYTRVEDYRALMHALRDTLEQRQAALEWLLEREPVDFLYVVLETLDRISHPAYGFLAPGAPTYESPLGAAVREEVLKVLEVQDRVMGRILELMGPDPAVMIVSDHGFCHPRKHFDLRSCLLDHGLMAAGGRLSFRGRLKPLARSLVTRTLGFGAWKWMSRFLRHTLGVQSQETPRIERWKASGKGLWDWSRSKTWFGPQMEYGIRVNTAGRMPESPVAPEARE